jgi:hypothetical protein
MSTCFLYWSGDFPKIFPKRSFRVSCSRD